MYLGIILSPEEHRRWRMHLANIGRTSQDVLREEILRRLEEKPDAQVTSEVEVLPDFAESF